MGEWEYSLFDFGGLHMTITAKIIRKGNTGYMLWEIQGR